MLLSVSSKWNKDGSLLNLTNVVFHNSTGTNDVQTITYNMSINVIADTFTPIFTTGQKHFCNDFMTTFLTVDDPFSESL